jgi:hypothetical protein
VLRSATQTSSAAATRAVGVVRSATQSGSATITAIKVKLLTLTATVTQVATVRRAISMSRAIVQTIVASVIRSGGAVGAAIGLVGVSDLLRKGLTASQRALNKLGIGDRQQK